MVWVNSEDEMKEKWDKYTKVPYCNGYLCINQEEDLKLCREAKALDCPFEAVVISKFKRECPGANKLIIGAMGNDTGLSNEPIPYKTLDPKSSHYDAGGIETIEILKAKLTKEQYKGYLLGNLIKYSTRANFKDQFNRDIEKINVYSEQLKQLNEEE